MSSGPLLTFPTFYIVFRSWIFLFGGIVAALGGLYSVFSLAVPVFPAALVLVVVVSFCRLHPLAHRFLVGSFFLSSGFLLALILICIFSPRLVTPVLFRLQFPVDCVPFAFFAVYLLLSPASVPLAAVVVVSPG